MKMLQTEISPGINSYVSLQERDNDFFKTPLHYHTELEMIYILEGSGKRIIGDKTATFAKEDLFFIGSNLPHAWLSDEIFYKDDLTIKPKAIVLYLNKDIFSQGFYGMKEAAKVNEFFRNAERGIHITGDTKTTVEKKLKALLHTEGFEKITGIFEVIHLLSQSGHLSFMVSDGYTAQLKQATGDRLADVYKYVLDNFKDNISLSDIAGVSNLTPQSFCRLFKKRTGKSFVEYLNQIRVAAACHYLLETDWNISEVAYGSGFKTVSNFNKLFKNITGTSPKIYKERSK